MAQRARADGDLRRIFRKYLPQVHWVSIETGACAPGTPDSNYCTRGVEGWIEYKQTTGRSVTLRPMQIAWLDKRGREGGRVLVAVRRRTADTDELWLLDGAKAREIRRAGLDISKSYTLGVWFGGPSLWPWGDVLSVLVTIR